MKHVVAALQTVAGKYTIRGFTVVACGSDNRFAALIENEEFLSLGIILNLTAKDEHEPYIKQFNRCIKKRCRMMFAGIPFIWLPKRMIVETVHAQVYWFNFTIPENCISDTLGQQSFLVTPTTTAR